jgi:transcriptional regulator with XRE-family HTH domain
VKTKDIGYRIRKLRESKDFSQENVAAELNISGSAYAKIERGVTDPPTSRLLEIAKVLEVDVSEFFSTTANKISEQEKQWGFATKSDIEALAKMIVSLKEDVEKLKAAVPSKPGKKSAPKKSK